MSTSEVDQRALGIVLGSSGDRAICQLNRAMLARLRESTDPAQRDAASVGSIVKIEVADRLLVGTLTCLNAESGNRELLLADVDYIGEGFRRPDGNLSSFRRGVTIYPHPGDLVQIAAVSDLQQIYSPQDIAHIEIGTVHPTGNIRAAVLFDKLLSRHFAVVGANGTGKSTMVTHLLNRIVAVAPQSHIIMLDPHGEYSRAFGDSAKVWHIDNLQIPFWLMNLDEHCEVFITAIGEGRAIGKNILAKCLTAARLRQVEIGDASRITADSPTPYRLEDLIEELMEQTGRLEKEGESHHYTQIRLNIERFFADNRYRFIFDQKLWDISMTGLLGDLLRIPVAEKPISIIELAGVPSEVVTVVVSMLARLIFDCAVWTPPEKRIPVLLICEEAHRYLPNIPSDAVISVGRQLERIAREGRKYGVALGLISQRPSEMSETALSQCGTILAMRLNNLRDQAQLKAILSEGSASYVDIIPALQNQECVISGEGVPVPMHVLIDTVSADLVPASGDPLYSERWKGGADMDSLLIETVRSWRAGG